MRVLDVILLAVALSMDAFAVSIGLASKQKHAWLNVALKAGCYFGGFQILMSAIGYLGGLGLMRYIEHVDHWIVFALLALIGIKMFYESFEQNLETAVRLVTHRTLVLLAIATSIDAMAAGFSLKLFDLNIYTSLLIIGVTTFVLSMVGVYLGHRGGLHFEKSAERFGGVVLIVIGFKILWEDSIKSLF